jgi:hypothetical protein
MRIATSGMGAGDLIRIGIRWGTACLEELGEAPVLGEFRTELLARLGGAEVARWIDAFRNGTPTTPIETNHMCKVALTMMEAAVRSRDSALMNAAGAIMRMAGAIYAFVDAISPRPDGWIARMRWGGARVSIMDGWAIRDLTEIRRMVDQLRRQRRAMVDPIGAWSEETQSAWSEET